MLKPFPYKDSLRVPWKYDAASISTLTGKEKVCSNVSSGPAEITRSGQCYTLEELEKSRKEIGKSIVEPVRNRITIDVDARPRSKWAAENCHRRRGPSFDHPL